MKYDIDVKQMLKLVEVTDDTGESVGYVTMKDILDSVDTFKLLRHVKRSKPKDITSAHLLANAPEMLDALEEAANVLIWAAQEAKGRVKAEIVGGWIYHSNKVREVIAKAKGE